MKIAATISIVLAVSLGGLWLFQGRHMGTLTERAVHSTTEDEFGDQVTTTSWEKSFEIGLDAAIPGIGGFSLLALGFLLLSRENYRKTGIASLVLGSLGLIAAATSILMAFTA